MTDLTPITFVETDIEQIAAHQGRIAVFVDPEGRLDAGARRVNRLAKGALARLLESERFEKAKSASVITLAFPAGMQAQAVDVVVLARNANVADVRKAGAALAKLRGTADVLALAGAMRRAAELAFGLAMRDYSFSDHKTAEDKRAGAVQIMCSKPDEVRAAAAPLLAVAEGAFMTRDLTNEPPTWSRCAGMVGPRAPPRWRWLARALSLTPVASA